MTSRTRRSFWDAHRKLPRGVRRQARRAYERFAADPHHPGLEFKRVGRRRLVYSVRVSLDYRALGVREGDVIVWF